MNNVVLMGRLTRDPEIRNTKNEKGEDFCIARYTLAVDRPKKGNEQTADFIPIVAMGKLGEFAEKYLHKGIKICVSGRIQTGSYTNKEGNKVYTTDVYVNSQEFAESKGSSDGTSQQSSQASAPASVQEDNGFAEIPDGVEEDLPFK